MSDSPRAVPDSPVLELLRAAKTARLILQRLFDRHHIEWVDDGQGENRSIEQLIERLTHAIGRVEVLL